MTATGPKECPNAWAPRSAMASWHLRVSQAPSAVTEPISTSAGIWPSNSGSNPKAGKRRYYCANAREKGAAICAGMPGVLQSDIETCALWGVRHGMMQDGAYERFRRDFETHLRETTAFIGEDLKLRDKMIAETESKKRDLLDAVASGEHSPAIIALLNQVDAELAQLTRQREAATPTPVELLDDLPALYRAHVEDLVGMLSDPSVRDQASDALRELVSVVRTRPRPEGGHTVELEGKLVEMLAKAKPAGEAGFRSNIWTPPLTIQSGDMTALERL